MLKRISSSEMPVKDCLIRPIHSLDLEEIQWVAAGMRRTLMEVLGDLEGRELYSPKWLEQRVRFHLDRDRCLGQVLICVSAAGCRLGYTIVRREASDLGLFSTTYVEPGWRRQGVAQALLARAEEWMRMHGLARAVTYTAEHNVKLQRLYLGRGYRMFPVENGFVQLMKEL